ncbi:hypothetical protein JL721_5717 [Aureococcus anophagefferens]|nr:hypothetical protein JL721_5717 [Aureococcus anophagefferens]
MDHFSSSAGSFKGKEHDLKAKSTSAAPAKAPAGGSTRAFKDETPDKPAGEGFMDHFSSPAPSFKGKDRDFKAATGASSGTPDWLGAAPQASSAATPAPAKAAISPPSPVSASLVPDAAQAVAGREPRRVERGPDGRLREVAGMSAAPLASPSTTAAPARPAAPPAPARAAPAKATAGGSTRAFKDETPDKPAGEGFMDHFSSPAPSFKGKDRDFKAPPASPAAPPAPARAAPAKATAGGSTRAFKDETPDKPAGEGFMDHFSSPAPSFKGKDRDFKAPPASPAAPPAPAKTAPQRDEIPDKPAGEGFMDHFSSPAPSFKGKDRDFKAPPRRPRPARPARAAPPRPRRRQQRPLRVVVARLQGRNPDKPAGEGFMDHFSSPAPSFKGKDRESKAKSTSSWTPDWLNPVQHASAAAALASAKDSGEKAAAGGSRDRFATTAGTFKGKDETPDKPAGEGYMDHFASPAPSFKGKDRDVKAATGASSGTPDSLGAAPPASPAAALASAEPAPAKAAVGVPIHPSTAGAFKGKPAGGSSTPAWFASVQAWLAKDGPAKTAAAAGAGAALAPPSRADGLQREIRETEERLRCLQEAEAAHKRDATITKTLFDFIGECEAAGASTPRR